MSSFRGGSITDAHNETLAEIRNQASQVHGEENRGVHQRRNGRYCDREHNSSQSPGWGRGPRSWATSCYQHIPIKLQKACFRHFPTKWKQGKLVTILKISDKDPKSLTLITLLSELGKILERIVLNQLHQEKSENQLFSGFRKEKSTVMALVEIAESLRNSPNHCLSIFVDISGDFDNLWWPILITVLV